MKKLLIFFSLFIFNLPLCTAQINIVNNPSFEDTVYCPDNYDQIYYATGWDTYLNTSDYYNSCSLHFGVPNNICGYQLSSNPNCHAYAGLANYNQGAPLGQEFIGSQLNTIMTIGQKYFLKMKVSLANLSCYASNNIGFLFSTAPYNFDNPASVNNFAHFNYSNIIDDTANWITITGSFIADSSYQYIIIGNFFDFNHTDILGINGENCLIFGAYYYIDDVCVSTDSSFCYNYTYVCGDGIVDYKKSNIKIYPNPASYEITIDIPEPYKNSNVLIYNILGEKIKEYIIQPMTDRIDISNLYSGVYFIQIKFNNKIIIQKIVIT